MSRRRPRPHEVVAAAYLSVTGLLAAALGDPIGPWVPLLLVHAALVALLLGGFPRVPEHGAADVLRDWLPFLALPLAYSEVGRLNALTGGGFHDAAILRLEAAAFGTQPSLTLREMIPWKPLSEYLHLGYFSYYALGPAYALPLYLRGRRAAYRQSLTVLFLVFAVCYLVFVLWPVAGPWYVFRRPDPDAMGWIFPHVEHAVLDAAASVGAAFPSSHVAAAVAGWLLAFRFDRSVFRVFAFFVPALAVGTVYGGFHYALDAAAGVAVGAAGYAAGMRLHAALGGEAEPRPARTYHVPRAVVRSGT
ncbi:MAG TPA: phosphatase PAP2 family protein [Gemmatimonadota bacterium]